MDASQKATLGVAVVLGLGVVGSYVPVFKDYKNHDYWLGLPQSTVRVYYALQVLAAVGFLTFLFSYCLGKPPKEGLLSYSPAVAPVLTTLLLLASIGWSVAVFFYFQRPSVGLKAATSLCLIVTAICALLLLAGYAESDTGTWYGLLGIVLFGVVAVLCDGVGWNARFLKYSP